MLKKAVLLTVFSILLICMYSVCFGYDSTNAVNLGETGTIILKAINKSESVASMEGVGIEIPNKPSWFIVKSSSLLGPKEIQPGDYFSFKIDVEVSATAQSGNYDVAINLVMNTKSCIPQKWETLHQFIVLEPSFSVSVDPPILSISSGESGTHTLFIQNATMVPENFSITVTPDGTPGWSVSAPSQSNITLSGGSSGAVTFDVSNNNAINILAITAQVAATTWNIIKTPENLDSSSGGHIFDHPDETYEVSTRNYPSQWKYDSKSSIGILATGWGEGLGYLLGKFDISTCLVKPNLTILNEPDRTLHDLKILLIGSAGLTGLDNSATFKQKLAEYVFQGGTIICFTQQHGYEFNTLPGGQISGYGWNEDESCWSNAVGIGTVSAIFNGQTKAQLDANVDGYLTTWPLNSTLLLNRTKNNMPAMIEYIYGQGRVIVSTLYTDWSYGHGQTSIAEQILIKQLVNYSLDPAMSPTQNLISIPPSTDFSFGVTTDSEQYAYNQPAAFTIHVWNHTNQEKIIAYDFNGTHKSSSGTITVPPAKEGTKIEMAAVLGKTFVNVYFKDQEGKILGYARSPLISTYIPSVTVNIQTDKISYGAGEVINTTLSLKNNSTSSYDTEIVLYVLDTSNNKITQYHDTINLPTGNSVTKALNFNLPEELSMGNYLIKAECFVEGKKVGEGTTAIEVPKPALFLQLELPTVLTENDNNVYVKITNGSVVNTPGGNLEFQLLDSQRSVIWTKSKEFVAIPAGGDLIVTENISLDNLKYGIYELNYSASYPLGFVKGVVTISNTNIVQAIFGKPSFNTNGLLDFEVNVYNNGNFAQKEQKIIVEIPDIGFISQTPLFDVDPTQKISFPFQLILPETLTSGQHQVKMTLTNSEGNTYTRTAAFIVPEGMIKATFEETTREQATIKLANVGGVGIQCKYNLELIDKEALVVHSGPETLVDIKSGEAATVTWTLPSEVGNSISAGAYYLKLNYQDVKGNPMQPLFQAIEISGTVCSLTVGTDKKIYTLVDPVNAQAEIVSNKGLNGAQLDIKITSANPAWTNYTNTDSIQQIIGDVRYLWFQTSGGIRRYDTQSDTWRKWTTADGLGGNRISNMLLGSDEVWSSSYDVPYEAINMRLSKIDKPAGTATSFPGSGYSGTVIGENADYVLTWFGGYSSPHLFGKHDHLWQSLEALWPLSWNSQAVILGNSIWILAPDQQNPSQNILYRYDITTKQLNAVLEGLSLTNLEAEGNILWLANDNGGFYRYDTVAAQLETISHSIAGYLVNNGNELWLIGSSNIVCYDKATKQFSPTYSLEAIPNIVYSQNGTPDYSRCFSFDTESVWIATADGIKQLHRNSGTWQTYTTSEGLLTNYTTSVAAQGDYIWIGTPIGISRYNKTVEWKTYTDGKNLKDVLGASSGADTLWLTATEGLLKYDQPNDRFITYQHSGLGKFIAVDSHYVWSLNSSISGTYLYKFTKETETWQEIDLQPILQTNNFTIETETLGSDEEALWLMGIQGGAKSLLRYDKNTEQATLYEIGPYYYAQPATSLSVDTGYVWIGTNPVRCFDKQSRQIVNTIPLPATKPIIEMSDAGTYLWLIAGEIGGPGTPPSPSSLITLYKIDKQTRQVLINETASYAGCLSYETGSNPWSQEAGGFIADGRSVWIAAYLPQPLTQTGINKVLRYDELNHTWKIYGTEDGLVGGYINDIVASQNYLWFTSDLGLGRFRRKGEIVWEKQIPVNSANLNWQENIGYISESGKYYIDGVLTSSLGQELAKATNNFYVAAKGIVMMLDTDQHQYKPGETITISGEVINIGETTENNINYTIQQDETILYTGSVSLAPGEKAPFTGTTIADKTFALKGTVTYSGNTNEVSQVVSVLSPQVDVTVTGPDEVGQDEFDLGILVKNTGQLEADVRCQISDAGQTKDLGQIILQAGETKYFSQSYTITQDTDFKVELTGDVIKTVTKTVKFGCATTVNITPALVYPASTTERTQIFEIPIEILNTGTKNLMLSLAFKLSPAQGSGWTEERGRSYYILPGEKAEEGLVFEGVPKGDYTLTYTSDLVSGSAFLQVAEFDVVIISEVEVDSSELALKGTLKGTAKVKNAGANEFVGNIAGSLMLKTESENRKAWEEEKELTLGLQEEKTIEFEIPIANLTSGEYSIVGTVFHNGSPIAEKSTALSLQPQFEITSFDNNQIFNAGGEASIKVKVKNNGPVAGQAEVTLASGDIINSTQALWLASGEEKEVTFSFTLADDLEEKTYNGTVTVSRSSLTTGGQEQQIQFYVNGYKIGVSSNFDKQVYKEGETAHLTLTLANEGSLEANVYTKVNFNDYEVTTDTITVSTGTPVNLTFDVPVHHTGQKLFYGIYHSSGRSLNLNTLYLYEEKEGISLTADKQQYTAAEQVLLYVIPASTGTLHLTAPGYNGDTEIINVSTSTLNFTLPQEILTGTHYVEYTFQTSAVNYTGKLPIDVVGYTVKTLEVTLDKNSYEPGQSMLFKLKLDSNKDIADCLLNAWLKSDSSYELVVSSQTQLTQGINIIEITTPMTLQDTGMAALVFGLYKGSAENELLLAAGQESFDVENVQTDTEAPVTELQILDPRYQMAEKTYITEQTRIYFVATDSGTVASGIELTEYSINNGNWNVYSSSFTITGEGEHTIQYRSKDKAGNVEEIKQAILVVDNTLPQSQLTVNSPQITIGDDKYLVSPASFTITAADTGSGIKEIEYQLNDQPWQVVASTGTSFSLAFTDGDHNLKYYSIDNLNHGEEVKTFAFKVDKTKPATQMTVNGLQVTVEDKTYITGTTEISLTSTDPIINGVSAGIAEINYRINASSWTVYNSTFTITGAGETTIEYYAQDKVGNREVTLQKTFWTDNEPPETKLQLIGSSWEIVDKTYISKETKMELTATDAGSGVEKITYQIDNSTPTIYAEPFAIAQEGVHSISYYSQDKLGNVEQAKQKTIYLDLTPPESTFQITEPKYQVIIDSITYVNSHSTFTLTAVDPVSNSVSSGLKQMQYKVDDNSYNIFSSTYTRINLSTISDGSHTISFNSVDNVESAETAKNYTAVFDGTKPEVKETYPKDKAMVSTKKLSAIKITFSEPVQCEDWYAAVEIKEIKKNGKEKEILTHKGKGKGFTISYDAATFTLSIESKFKNNREYEIALKNTIADRVYNYLDEYKFNFKTMLSAKEGGTVYDQETGLLIIVLPNTLPCDGYFETRIIEQVNPPKLPKPLCWLFDGRKAYQIIFRNEENEIVKEQTKQAFKVVIILKNNWLALSAGQSETQEPIDLEHTQVYQTGTPEDIAIFQRNQAILYNGETSRLQKPILLSSQNVDTKEEEITAQVNSFGIFGLATYRAPEKSLDDLSCYPSPFDPYSQRCTIQYYLEHESEVAVAIYDLLGNLVRTWEISNGEQDARSGLNQLQWDGKNDAGNIVANGGYIVFVHADGEKRKFKVMVVK